MKLWLLRPAEGLPTNDDPWADTWDCCYGYVVRAETEELARAAAEAEGGHELRPSWHDYQRRPCWTDPTYATCVELLPEGEPGIVLRDFLAG